MRMHTGVSINPAICRHTICGIHISRRVNDHSGIQCQRTCPTINSVCSSRSGANIDGSTVDRCNTTIANTITGVRHRLCAEGTSVDGNLRHTGSVAGRITGANRAVTIYAIGTGAIRRFRTISTTIDCYLGACHMPSNMILINLFVCSSDSLVGYITIIIVCTYIPCFLVICTQF